MKQFLTSLAILFAAVARAETIQADLCVYEATPGGIAMAVRAAREGLSVVLVNHGPEPFEITRGMRIAQLVVE